MSKIIAVHGATGAQGGSVVRSLLKSDWKVRAITRNTASDSAKALIKLGAEVFTADFDHEESLKKAYEGVEAIFLVTNFWEHIVNGSSPKEAGQQESDQALTAIKIADKLPGLKHLIWSTLPGNAPGQKERIEVHHFDFKAKLDHTIRTSYPTLAAKTTFLYIGWYGNNFINAPIVKPFTTPFSDGAYFWLNPTPPTTIFPSAGDNTINVGLFTLAILSQPSKTLGRYVSCVVDLFTGQELLELWAKTAGVKASFLEATAETWNTAFGHQDIELQVNYRAFAENDKFFGDNSPLTGKDLGIEGEVVGTKALFERVKAQLL